MIAFISFGEVHFCASPFFAKTEKFIFFFDGFFRFFIKELDIINTVLRYLGGAV